MNNFFYQNIKDKDPELSNYINQELQRQQNNIELIASENIVSTAVLEAAGSILTNKYAEGYPSARYYGGCEEVDKIEQLAIDRACKLFNSKFANVQPHSGSQANFAVYLALLNPNDCILGMSLNSGGHLTHGSKVSVSGKWFNAVSYEVNSESELLDYEQIEKLALQHKPKIIIAGGSAYSRIFDFKKFREIADKVGAYLMVDMAHFAGLVAGGLHPNPIEYADVVTSTTHKTLRGPRGGLILTNNEKIAKKINSAIFPGSQGGPLVHIIAGKAVAFKEALEDDFKTYIKQVVENTKVMADVFTKNDFRIVANGTDNHLFMVDLVNSKAINNNITTNQLTGDKAEKLLDEVSITCNKNSIPFDTLPPKITSGIRIGAAAITTRGMKAKEAEQITNIIIKIFKAEVEGKLNNELKLNIKAEINKLTNQFPIYKELKY
ncbi:serine hydroxymethyltransferase [Rickettsiales bacterium LUAb2]